MKSRKTIHRLETDINCSLDSKEKSYWTVQWELAPQDCSVIIGTVFRYEDDFDTRPRQIFQEDKPKLFHDLQKYLTDKVYRYKEKLEE